MICIVTEVPVIKCSLPLGFCRVSTTTQSTKFDKQSCDDVDNPCDDHQIRVDIDSYYYSYIDIPVILFKS